MPILIRKMTFLYAWAMGLYIGMQFDFCRSQFSGEVWSSLREEPQKIRVERLQSSFLPTRNTLSHPGLFVVYPLFLSR